MTDVERLRAALVPVEIGAQGLAWNKERPWLGRTHVWQERGVPTVDLHDLGRRLALDTLDALAGLGPDLQAGAVRLIVGRGHHSLTGPVLPRVTLERLQELCAEHDWQFHADGAARMVWIFDPERAPPAALGALPWWVWLWFLVLAALGLALVLRRLGG